MDHEHRPFLGRRGAALLLGAAASLAVLASCGSDDSGAGGGGGTGGAAGAAGASSCPTPEESFEAGDPSGHADPYGAKAAGQARAGRLGSEPMIVQPAHGRQRARVGDFVLVNDRVAVTIEDQGLSDGYARFGGEILAVDRVGDDGRPLGTSLYGETLMALGVEMVETESVGVVNDGSDGQPAVIRAVGKLAPIPFLDGSLGKLFPRRYGLQAAWEYVLAPGSDKLSIRVGIKNPAEEPLSFVIGQASDEMHGFFHYSRNRIVSAPSGFGKIGGTLDWIGFVNEGTSFAWRPTGGEQLDVGLEVSGFIYTLGPGFEVPACSTSWTDHAEVIVGGPEYDSLREALRRVDGVAPWRAVTGTVKDASGAPVADAFVHLLDDKGGYLSRVRTDASGAYALHAPPGQTAQLVAQKRGYALTAPTTLAASATEADLTFGANGTITVSATDKASGVPLPVRVQVIPTAAQAGTPDAYGLEDERNGRLHQDYAITGQATLTVPPGEHRVIVTRGSEWELVDQTVTVAAGATTSVAAELERSVDSTGWMCADFHIHSHFSADSSDSVKLKVASAIADGLELPVSSEHEWVIDFQPTIVELGLQKWAFGMPSEELTTFTWGHFGVVPLLPKPDELNAGAVEWIGLEPPAMFGDVQSRPENPVLIVNHPSKGGFGAYFSQAGFDPKTGKALQPTLWSTNFDAVEVFQGSGLEENRDQSVADWFGLLNAGLTMWAVGSSDSHHVRSSPVGYPRTCLYFGHDDPTKLTADTVRDVLAQGVATVSGGLFMTVEGPNGEKPSSTIQGAGSSAAFTVTVQAPSWGDATTLEVIVDGVTQKTEPLAPFGTGPGKRFVNQVTVALDPTKARSWVVFHARGDGDLSPLHPGSKPFAVSNPVFFEP